MGVVIAGLLLASGPWLGGVFTDDRAVAEAVRGVVPQAALMQPLGALVFVADGIFMAVLAVRLLAASTGRGPGGGGGGPVDLGRGGRRFVGRVVGDTWH